MSELTEADGFVSPVGVLRDVAIPRGSRVADFGSGTGSFSLAAARIVGEGGRVYAIDVQKDLLQKLASAAAAEGLNWIDILWGDVDELGGSKLADESVDFVLLVNTVFQLDEPAVALREAFRVLKPGGKLVLVDWKESFGGMGPSREHVVSEQDAKGLADRVGFAFERAITAGSHHYGFVCAKAR